VLPSTTVTGGKMMTVWAFANSPIESAMANDAKSRDSVDDVFMDFPEAYRFELTPIQPCQTTLVNGFNVAFWQRLHGCN
jgi:hypothetical protein